MDHLDRMARRHDRRYRVEAGLHRQAAAIMVWQFVILLVSLVVLVAGGESLVRGASALARRWGVSALVIGLTVVAFGTSAPELAVSVSAALQGSSEIALGNVVGSNICNIALLLGLTAMLMPLAVGSQIVSREVPMMILASTATLVLALDSWFAAGARDELTRGDGVVLLLLFSVFLYYTAMGALRRPDRDPLVDELQAVAPDGGATGQPARWITVGPLVLGGLGGLVAGGHFLVEAAATIARSFGVSEITIGLTIVAVGTSLPELVTCLIAAHRGEADIAVGNVVGSNIFNLLMVLATTATVRPIPVPAGSAVELVAMLVLALAMMPIVMKTHRITRLEGAVLLAGFVGFVGWQTLRS